MGRSGRRGLLAQFLDLDVLYLCRFDRGAALLNRRLEAGIGLARLRAKVGFLHIGLLVGKV